MVIFGKKFCFYKRVCRRPKLDVVKVLREVEGKLQKFLSGLFVVCYGLLDVGRASSSREVFLLYWKDAVPDGFLAMPVFDRFKRRARFVLKRIG